MLYSYKNSATSRVRQASGRSKGSAAVTAHQPATSTSEGIVVKIKPPATYFNRSLLRPEGEHQKDRFLPLVI